jgi:hypothetical protein
MTNEGQTIRLNLRRGVLLLNIYEEDGHVWMTEPDTGVRVGIGRLEDSLRTPFVCINTELAADEPRQDTDAPGEPILRVDLNDSPIYRVTTAGASPGSLCHIGQRAQRAKGALAERDELLRRARTAHRKGMATRELNDIVIELIDRVHELS